MDGLSKPFTTNVVELDCRGFKKNQIVENKLRKFVEFREKKIDFLTSKFQFLLRVVFLSHHNPINFNEYKNIIPDKMLSATN